MPDSGSKCFNSRNPVKCVLKLLPLLSSPPSRPQQRHHQCWQCTRGTGAALLLPGPQDQPHRGGPGSPEGRAVWGGSGSGATGACQRRGCHLSECGVWTPLAGWIPRPSSHPLAAFKVHLCWPSPLVPACGQAHGPPFFFHPHCGPNGLRCSPTPMGFGCWPATCLPSFHDFRPAALPSSSLHALYCLYIRC